MFRFRFPSTLTLLLGLVSFVIASTIWAQEVHQHPTPPAGAAHDHHFNDIDQR
jgi:hypothetical protein